MNATNFNSVDIGINIASALLIKNKRLGVNEIEAIPFVTEKDVPLIIRELVKKYKVRVTTEKISEHPYLEWRKVLTLSRTSIKAE